MSDLDKYAHGKYNVVAEFVFPDRFCIARISMYALTENEQRAMESEVQTTNGRIKTRAWQGSFR